MYSLYRAKEREAEMWLDIAEGLEETVTDLQKEARSDKALIESLNRYIEALEGKAAMQAENIKELQGQMGMSSTALNVGIGDLMIPKDNINDYLMFSEELELIRDLCQSPNIENNTKELLKKDLQSLKNKIDILLVANNRKNGASGKKPGA